MHHAWGMRTGDRMAEKGSFPTDRRGYTPSRIPEPFFFILKQKKTQNMQCFPLNPTE